MTFLKSRLRLAFLCCKFVISNTPAQCRETHSSKTSDVRAQITKKKSKTNKTKQKLENMAKICHVTRPQGKRKSNVRTESHLCPVIRLFALARAGKPAGGTIARKWRIIWEKRRSVCSTPMNRRRKSRSTEGGDKWHCHLNYQPRQKNHLGPKHR